LACKWSLAYVTRSEEDETTVGNSARERILDASLKSFGEKGFRGSTTKEIAIRARAYP
jgi:AcrR family transcriptional regulator